MSIKVFVSDLGNVLIPFDYGIAIKRLNEISDGLGDRFINNYKEMYHLHRQFEKGEIKETKFLAILSGAIGYKIDNESLCKIYSEIFVLNYDLIELLPMLKSKYKLVLLSNTNSIHQKYGWGGYEFLKYFDKLILSHQVGAVKPEKEIYKAVEEFSKCKPEEHFFIDDIPEYVDGAKKCGWDGAVYTNITELKTILKGKYLL